MQALGSATLLRNRCRILIEHFKTIEVLFVAGHSGIQCPMQGATLSYQVFNDEVKEIAVEYLNQKKYDVIYSSYDFFGSVLSEVKSKKVVEIHDVIHLRQASFEHYGYEPPFKCSPEKELISLSKYDAVICLNTNEDRYLKSKALKNVHFIPPNFEASKFNGKRSRSLGLMGSCAKPNIDGFEYYRNGILSADHLVVAGGLSTLLNTEKCSTSVESIGVVQNLSDFYEKIGAALVPVRFGGGIKIKAIESLAHGLPIFSTTHGVEGLPPGVEAISIVSDAIDDWTMANYSNLLDISSATISDYFERNFSDQACVPLILQAF